LKELFGFKEILGLKRCFMLIKNGLGQFTLWKLN